MKKVTQPFVKSSCWRRQTNHEERTGLPRPKDGQLRQFLRVAVMQCLDIVNEEGMSSRTLMSQSRRPMRDQLTHWHAQRSIGRSS